MTIPISEDLPPRIRGWFIRGEGRDIIARIIDEESWPETPILNASGRQYTADEVNGDEARWYLSKEDVSEITHWKNRVPLYITVDSRSVLTGVFNVTNQGAPESAQITDQLRIIIGPRGPKGDSGDVGVEELPDFALIFENNLL